MAKKAAWWSLGTPLVVFLLVIAACAFVIQQQTSPLVSVTQWMGGLFEGFSSPTKSPICPSGYTFYTDSVGESLCCKGTINPFTHTCSVSATASTAADSYGGICAFRPGVSSPLSPGTSLPLCATVTDAIQVSNNNTKCPPSLPNYVAITPSGTTTLRESCCKTGPNADGTDCSPADITAKTFCRINPTSTFSGTDCTVVKLSDQSGGCPVGLQSATYTMGTTETNENSALAGVSVPACMGIEHSCFPDNVAQYFKTNNLFSKIPSDPKKWVYSCSGYQQYYVANDRSDTSMVTDYV
jgi:hypothetical protein